MLMLAYPRPSQIWHLYAENGDLASLLVPARPPCRAPVRTQIVHEAAFLGRFYARQPCGPMIRLTSIPRTALGVIVQLPR
jgi:hypothetical protein